MASIEDIEIAAKIELFRISGESRMEKRKSWLEGILECIASQVESNGDVEALVTRVRRLNPSAFEVVETDAEKREAVLMAQSKDEQTHPSVKSYGTENHWPWNFGPALTGSQGDPITNIDYGE
jgi:hypothetical protein